MREMLEAQPTVGGGLDARALADQDLARDVAVDRVVLDQQHRQVREARAGEQGAGVRGAARLRTRDRGAQDLEIERLAQGLVDQLAGLGHGAGQGLLPMRGQHQHQRPDQAAPRARTAHGFGAVDAGQLEIDQHQADFRQRRRARRQRRQRALAIHEALYAPAVGAEHGRGDLGSGGVVLHDERELAIDRIQRRRRQRARLEAVEAQAHAKTTADAGLAFDLEAPVHELDQPAADRQAEAGAAEAPRGRGLALIEGLENARDLFGVDADAAVAHSDRQVRMRGAELFDADGDRHVAARSELERVADDIQHHLAQPHRIADQRVRRIRIDLDGEAELLVARAGAEDHADVFEQLAQRERLAVDRDASGFKLGEVQEVVEDRQQGARGAIDLLRVVALRGRELGLLQQVHEAENRRHRRADLVAHVGQELAARTVRALGQRARFGQAQLGQAALGQVDQQ